MKQDTRRPSPPHAIARGAAGFTVIELLIAVAIAGILVAVAYPSFLDAIRKSRRSAAFTALAGMQQAQERWRTNNANYTVTLADLGLGSATTSSGYYTLSAEPPSTAADALATGYIVTAEGVTGTSQANDAQCRRLSIKVEAGVIKYAGCGSCSTFNYAPSDACWAR